MFQYGLFRWSEDLAGAAKTLPRFCVRMRVCAGGKKPGDNFSPAHNLYDLSVTLDFPDDLKATCLWLGY